MKTIYTLLGVVTLLGFSACSRTNDQSATDNMRAATPAPAPVVNNPPIYDNSASVMDSTTTYDSAPAAVAPAPVKKIRRHAKAKRVHVSEPVSSSENAPADGTAGYGTAGEQPVDTGSTDRASVTADDTIVNKKAAPLSNRTYPNNDMGGDHPNQKPER